MMNIYKAIAIDLDGTLLRDDKTISTVNLNTLAEVQKKGIRLIIASGRPTYGVAPIADTLQLRQHGGYVLAYNGGEIYDWGRQRLIYANTLHQNALPYLYHVAKQNGLELLTYHNQYVVSEDENNPYVRRSSRSNKMPIRKVNDFIAEVSQYDIVKCMIVGDPDRLKVIEQEIALKLSSTATVFRSEPFYLEIVPPMIDKGRCLALLLPEIKVKPEEVIAFGDGYNDISMIEFVGLGFAMANAPEAVRKSALHTAPTNEADGVAKMIREYCL